MRIQTSDLRAFLALLLSWAIIGGLAFSGLAWGSERGTLAILRSFPVHVSDREEEPATRDARLAEIARAIDAVTEDPTGRAALLTLVRFESGAAAYVHEDRCSDGPRGSRECDAGRARGHWQLHANNRHPRIPDGLEEQASIALRLWRGSRERCARVVSDDLAGAFSAYGTGGHCAPAKWSTERAAFMRRIVRRL